jgi:hypothetical protein
MHLGCGCQALPAHAVAPLLLFLDVLLFQVGTVWSMWLCQHANAFQGTMQSNQVSTW